VLAVENPVVEGPKQESGSVSAMDIVLTAK